MAMAARVLRRAAVRSPLRSRMMSSSTEATATTANTTATSTGPPFKKFFWITTGIMVGVPGVLGAAFVYNLKTDDEFYEHFSDKYPDVVALVNEYVPLNEDEAALAARDDVGDVARASEYMQETVTVVAELASGKTVRFQAQGSSSQAEIEALARQHASASPSDRVISIVFDEEDDGEEAASPSAQVGEVAPGTSRAIPTAAAWPPAPRKMWTGKAPQRRVDAGLEARQELESIRRQQAELEASKFTGRDIDDADEEIRVLEERKEELKKLLPRKRFLWIF